ncbi:MAG: AAA family ATPase [Candidatus Nanohaloarchaeota archaeon QJJ-7]|nr:AAA family ATPase [Candidatus Nanohaloarchaeota archaeon QJJ-7]
MTGIPLFEDHEEGLIEKYEGPGEKIFTVSGLTGVGTGTLSELLAEHYGLEHIDAGHFFREKAEEHGMSINEFRSEAERIEEEENVDFDQEWDRTALEYAFKKDELLLEARLSGVLLQDIAEVRVWVECDPRTVAERLKGRETLAEKIPAEDVNVEEIVDHIQQRNQEDLETYREKYGVDPSKEEYYNIVIDNSRELEEVKRELFQKVSGLV